MKWLCVPPFENVPPCVPLLCVGAFVIICALLGYQLGDKYSETLNFKQKKAPDWVLIGTTCNHLKNQMVGTSGLVLYIFSNYFNVIKTISTECPA